MKYIIAYDVGYGTCAEEIEADSLEIAIEISWEVANEAAQSEMFANAVGYNEENCDEYGIDWEPEYE